ELDKVVRIMKENPNMVIELGAHTDSRGTAEFNQKLSDKRAKSSIKYITSRGISKDRISGKGYGESRLKISDNEINKVTSTEERNALHQKNRRTEFIIVRVK
ncbi:MAG TPA: OmpA family protein, partial [Taishania sp.]|nr:OmpA family protein [Taishania sp.]